MLIKFTLCRNIRNKMLYKQYYKNSKYNNKKAEYGGHWYHSKFEAGVARDLDLMKRAGEILDWDKQYKVECIPYNCHGAPVHKCKVTHKVDFRKHNLDGTFTLLEAKGFETDDYKMRRKWLLEFWLPEHPDHDYEVVKQGSKGWREFKR